MTATPGIAHADRVRTKRHQAPAGMVATVAARRTSAAAAAARRAEQNGRVFDQGVPVSPRGGQAPRRASEQSSPARSQASPSRLEGVRAIANLILLGLASEMRTRTKPARGAETGPRAGPVSAPSMKLSITRGTSSLAPPPWRTGPLLPAGGQACEPLHIASLAETLRHSRPLCMG